jgi:autotransporter adhesin
VAAGQLSATSTDAVNGSQLFALGTEINTAVNGGGIKYFHANSTLPDSSATGANSVAIGPNAVASLDNSVALGNGATTTGASDISGNAALGITHNAGAVAAGSGNVVSVGSVGNERQIQNVAAGAVNVTSTDAVNGSQLFSVTTNVNAIGSSTASAIGGGATYTPGGGISAPNYTLNGSATTYSDVVSGIQALANGAAGPVQYSTPGTPSNSLNLVGTGDPVTLGNLAAGEISSTSHQAVNGSQLYGTANSVANALGGGAGVNSSGQVTAPTYNVGGTNYNDVGSALGAVGSQIGALQNQMSKNLYKANAGTAAAMAAGTLIQAVNPGKSVVTGGYGEWQGQSAFAFGLSHRFENNWTIKAAAAFAARGGGGVAAAAGYEF